MKSGIFVNKKVLNVNEREVIRYHLPDSLLNRTLKGDDFKIIKEKNDIMLMVDVRLFVTVPVLVLFNFMSKTYVEVTAG